MKYSEYYEIAPADVGKAIFQMVGEKWPQIKAFPIGCATERDIGKRVYLLRDVKTRLGVVDDLRIESAAELEKRLKEGTVQ